MTLGLKIVDTPYGRNLLLVDEDGLPIPGQKALTFTARVDDLSEVTVTFAIDGERVRFVR